MIQKKETEMSKNFGTEKKDMIITLKQTETLRNIKKFFFFFFFFRNLKCQKNF